MNILLVNTGVFPIPPSKGGGTEYCFYYIANSLAKLGHEVHIVSDTVNKGHFHREMVIHKIHAPHPSFRMGFYNWILNHLLGGSFAFKAAFQELIRDYGTFDIVHAFGRLGALLLSTFKLGDYSFVYSLEDFSPYFCTYDSKVEQIIREIAYRNIVGRICKNADHVIAVNQTMKKMLTLIWKMPEVKVTVIPNGVDTNFFIPSDKSEDIYCLFVGQLTPRKGVQYLIRAIEESNKNISCIIVGDGPQKPNLIELTNKLNSKRIRFVGHIGHNDKLRNLYSCASFFVLPSISEGLPLSVLEALASGCPVIATEIPGITDVVKDGYNGFLVKPKDVKTLSDRIETLVVDSKLREAMGKNARQTSKQFDWNQIAKKVITVYEKLQNSS